jgi:ferrous iron transport protein A
MHTKSRMQVRGNKTPGETHAAGQAARNLTVLKRGQSGILERIDLPEDDARRLMELGFLPGHTVTRAHAAPGGDPRVFQVDGSEVALRRETAVHLIIR